MIKLVIERDVIPVSLSVFIESLTATSLPIIKERTDAFIQEINDFITKGVFYKAECDSVFAGIYIIDLKNKDVLYSRIRRTKIDLKPQIDLLLNNYFAVEQNNYIKPNSIILQLDN